MPQVDPALFKQWQDALPLAGIVGGIVGVISGAIQLWLGVVRQRKEDERKRAEMGYKLLDTMFDDEWSGSLLYLLDGINSKRYKGVTANSESKKFKKILILNPPEPLTPELEKLQRNLDAVLYFFDRFEHAIRAGLTDFGTVEMPIGYYISLLAKHKTDLLAYIDDIGYERVIYFLERFDEWKKPNP
jgi:hypothetical protein